MKRFLIHVSTSWCGMDDTFRAMAENDYELDEIANQLAYENFQFYDCENDIAEEFGYDPDDMEDEDWDKLWEQTSEGDYYHYTIEEFEGDDEDILSRSWNRYFYDVEANTIEEAVEKVRYGEVDCYDSEQIYEVIDELDPVDNNGSPTREIYNDKDELMWHNAELVNGGEIITQSIRSISENLSLIMEGEPELFRGGDIAFSTARRVMEMLGWKCSYAGKATLGQDAYYCIICTKPDKDFKYKIFGNAYEGSISISKEKL